MSDVIVSTTESTTNVTTTNDVTTIAITDTVVEVSQATAGLQGPPGSNSDPTYVYVTNKTGAQLNKGAIVYVSGANGTHTQVSLAIATGDVTSARTLGWLVDDIANNATGLCCISGYLDGVNTQGVTEGAQLYLSPTVAGGFTATKPGAPDHMVYVGICAKASAGNGRVFVHIQNGAELEELHDVKIISPQNNDLLRYVSGTALWENVAATAITVGSAIVSGTASYATNANYATTSGTSVYSAQSGTASYATAALSATSSNSAYTALIAGTAVFANTAGTSTYALSAGTATALTGSISRSQITDFTSGTVASADYATLAGTASFATAASTATNAGAASNAQYAVQAGTAVNISGTVLQSQVSNLTTDLAGKANLVGGNSFTGAQVISASTATQIPVQVRAAASPSVNVQEWDNSLGAVQASIDSNFYGNFPRVTAGGSADLGYAILSVNTGATANKGLVVRGVLNQSANLFEIQTSTGSTAVRINQVGNTTFSGNISSNNNAFFSPASTATVPLTVQGLASQTSSYFEVQNSAAATLFRVNSSGFAVAPLGFIAGGAAQASGANNTLYSTGTASVGLVVRGIASQSANLQEWQLSSGSTALAVNSAGLISATRAVTITQINTGEFYLRLAGVASQTGDFLQVNDPSANPLFRIASTGAVTAGGTARLGQVTVIPASTATVGVVVQGASGQAVNAFEYQNSGGTVLARIAASGSILGQTMQTINGSTIMREGFSGGVFEATKSTAAQNNPGANIARLYFRDGTNAGTLKLVVRAGATGAETTILDNIPT